MTPTAIQTSRARTIFRSFYFNLLLVSLVIGAFMFTANVSIGAIGQGLSYSLVGVAVYLTFRVLDFPDLTVDAAFPIGAAVSATMIVSGISAEMTLFGAFLAGALTGLVTALIHIFLKIEGLLASIIVLTAGYTITLRIMANKSNLPLLNERTILTPYQRPFRTWLTEQFGDDMRRYSNNIIEILVFALIVLALFFALKWFMDTEIGLTLRATGKNSQMVRALGINHQIFIVIGLMLSNGLTGLAGSLAAQQLGFADVSLGLGIIVRGLAAVMIGEVLLRPKTIGQHILAAIFGMLVFDISRAWVFTALDLPASDIRLVSALVVLSALAAPYLSSRWQAWQSKRAKTQSHHRATK